MSSLRLIALCSVFGLFPASYSDSDLPFTTDYTDLISIRPLPEKILNSSVWLQPSVMPGAGVGTGVAILIDGKKAIITAEHVAAALPYPMDVCSFSDNCIYNLQNFISDSSSDIATDWAIYFVEEFPEGVVPIRISSREPAIGDELWSVGRAFGDSPMIVKGTLSWIETGSRKLYILNTYSVPGFSGGGVFNIRGELVGITVAIRVNEIGTQENYVLVVPTSEISLLR